MMGVSEREEKTVFHTVSGKESKKMISATKEQVEEAVVKIITENKNNVREA